MGGTFILNRDTLEPIAVIEDYTSIEYERNFFTFGKWNMEMNFHQFNARNIEKGQLIGIALDIGKSFDHVFMVEQIEFNQGSSAIDETITVSGRDIGGMTEERLIIPPSGQAYESINGSAESIMKFYTNLHLASGALDIERRLPNLFIVTDQARGINIDYQTRFQVLSDVLEEIGRQAEMGWQIFFESSTNTFQFDIILGEDKSSTVILDFNLESLLTLRRLSTDWGKKNFAFVGGKGEGDTRPVDTTFLGMSEPSGFERREAWVDAQDQDEVTVPTILTSKGEQFLRETDFDDAVEVDINQFGPYEYRVDYDLGDVILVRNNRWNFTKAMQIIQVKVKITTQFPRPFISVVLDKPLPRLLEKIKFGFDQTNPSKRR